jgi:hypothetical protein
MPSSIGRMVRPATHGKRRSRLDPSEIRARLYRRSSPIPVSKCAMMTGGRPREDDRRVLNAMVGMI